MKHLIILFILLGMITGAQAAYENITYISGNGTSFTYNTSATIVNSSTTIDLPLTGSGAETLIFFGPNATEGVNMTGGYQATNATSIKVVWTNATVNNTITVVTDATVTNPIISIRPDNSMSTSNMPAAVVGAGIVTAVVILYFRSRRNR